MQANCHEAPQPALATNQPAQSTDVAHHTSDQFMYQGAVVLAVILFLVSLWSL